MMKRAAAFSLVLWCLAGGLSWAAEAPANVNVRITVEHDHWRVPDIGITGRYYNARPGQWYDALGPTGNAAVPPDARPHVIEGLMGWRVPFAVTEAGELTVGAPQAGKLLAAPPRVQVQGTAITVLMPPMFEVTLDIPDGYQGWQVEGDTERHVGRRSLLLPAGRFPVRGSTGWSLLLVVDENGVAAEEISGGPYAIDAARVRSDGHTLVLPPAPWHRVIVQVPWSYGDWNIGAFIRDRGDAAVDLPPGDYRITGREGWRVAFTVAADGALSVGETVAGKTALAPGSVQAEGGRITIPAPVIEPPPPPAPAVYVFTKDSRRNYRQGETVEISVAVRGENLAGKKLRLSVKGEAPLDLAAKFVSAADSGRRTFTWRLNTACLKPGDYVITAAMDGLQATAPLTIVPPEQETDFKIVVYHGSSKREVLDEFAEGGLNLQIHNGLGPNAVKARLNTRDARQMAAWERAVAYPDYYFGPPVELALGEPPFRRYLDDLVGRRIELLAQFGAGHQFYHHGTCFVDPHLYKSISRGTMAFANVGREFPNFIAINLGDEMGTHRGCLHPEGCPYCRGVFEAKYGAPVPKSPAESEQLWRRWMDYKQEQFPTLMRYVGEHVKRIADVMMSSQHGGANFWPQDGGYPPVGMREFDVSAGHWYFLASAYGQHSLLYTALGDDFAEMVPHKMAYWPFMWPRLGYEAMRHELYICLLRECEGCGYFTPPSRYEGVWEQVVKNDHPRLKKFGNLFLNLDRNRDAEVAILYSYDQHQNDCYVEPGVSWVKPVRRYLDAVSAAYYACLRAHVPVSLVCDDQIRRGALDRRTVLLMPKIRRLDEDVRRAVQRWIDRGGVAFVDTSATMQFRGARKIDVDFDLLFRRLFQEGEFAQTPKPISSADVIMPMVGPVRAALEPHVKLTADSPSPWLILASPSPWLILAEQFNGEGRYVFALNDKFEGLQRNGRNERALFAPIDTTMTIAGAGRVVYDVFEGRPATVAKTDAGLRVPVKLGGGDLKLLAVLPRTIGGVEVTAEPPARWGDRAYYSVRVLDQAGGLLRTAVPLEITVYDGADKPRSKVWRATTLGTFDGEIQVACNEARGTWRVAVKELLSGAEAEARFTYRSPDKEMWWYTHSAAVVRVGPLAESEAARFVQETGDVIVYDKQHVESFLRTKRRVLVVVGRTADLPLARRIAHALETCRGMKAEVTWDSILRRNRFSRYFGHGVWRGRWGVRIADPQWEINHDLVLVGDCKSNALIGDLLLRTERATRLLTPDFPGRGRGMIQHVYNAFSDEDFDTTVVCAFDENGLRKATLEFINMVRPQGMVRP